MIRLKDCFIWTCSPVNISCKYDNKFIYGPYINDRFNYFMFRKNEYKGINTLKFYKL